MKFWIKFLVVVAFLLFGTTHGIAQKSNLIRLTFGTGWDALPALVAIERGFFAQEKELVVSGMSVSSTRALIQSIATGSSDFVAISQRTLLFLAAAKQPVKVVAMNGWGTKLELVVPKGNTTTKSLADLRGKTIGIGRGSETLPVLIRLLNRAKMRPTDVKVKYLSAVGVTEAFKKKHADAVIEMRQFTSVLTQKGQGRVVLKHENIVKEIGYIGAMPLVTRNSLIEKEPATVQKVVNGWVKALAYIQGNPEDSARILRIFFHRQGTTVSAGLARSWINMTRYDQYSWSPGALVDAGYNGWGMKEGGVLKVLPKLDGYVDNRFVNKAVKALEQAGASSQKGKQPPKGAKKK
jgi:ABC-type nitrate/sulfonate/bicarbonate transport system substrate-binding protein